MLQFKLLEGETAGDTFVVGRLPCHIGRGAGCEVRLNAPGVWERHAELRLLPSRVIELNLLGEALATVNQEPVRQVALRNGDVIGLGSAKLVFTLGPAQARKLGLREALTWICLGAWCLGQIALVYWLPG